jgi:hypothetical protein
MVKDRAQKPHQNVKDKENDESSNSSGHEDYHHILIGGWNFLSFHRAQNILS